VTIYHVTTRALWREAQESGVYSADSLLSEGFIHCATFEQLPYVMEAHFPGIDDLIALVIEPSMLRAAVRFEGAGDEKFPHVYGSIPVAAVSRVINFSVGNSFTNAI